MSFLNLINGCDKKNSPRSLFTLAFFISAFSVTGLAWADNGQTRVIEQTSQGPVVKTVQAKKETPEEARTRETLDEEWQSTIKGLLPLGGKMVGQFAQPDDPRIREEVYRFIYSTIAQGYMGLLYADPKYPDFWPIWNHAFNTIDPNPDNVYYMTPIDDDGVYRISGNRGSTHIVSFLIGSGEFLPYGRGTFGPTLTDYYLGRDVPVEKNGSFEVILSAERPEGYEGTWWKLPPTASFINVRQTSYDWLNEVDARLSIQRLDVPTIKPRLSKEEIADKLRQIPTWAENVTKLSISWFQSLAKMDLVNKMKARDLSSSGGIKNQAYIEGIFDLAPDEALIVETEVPKSCLYWAFQLTDDLFVSIDPLNRQTSLNGFSSPKYNGYSATLDSDGKFRAVVAASDPGVPNWLDTAGYKQGIMFGRWTHCSSSPTPTVTKVKLKEVRQHLPADTAVVSAAEREAALRLRRQAVQMRKKW